MTAKCIEKIIFIRINLQNSNNNNNNNNNDNNNNNTINLKECS